jgi:hypothetical protein
MPGLSEPEKGSVMNGKQLRGIVVGAIMVLLAFAGPARAQNQLIHGNAAEPQLARDWVSINHMPFGLEGYLKLNMTTEVYLPLATFKDSSRVLTRVRTLFYAAPDVHVIGISVWDGGTQIKSKTGSWTGNLNLYLKMPVGYQVQHGLSVSLTLQSGSSANVNERRFVLNSGAAEYKYLLVMAAE